jgi:hypothetical protein
MISQEAFIMAINLSGLVFDDYNIGVTADSNLDHTTFLSITFGVSFSSGTISAAGLTEDYISPGQSTGFSAAHAPGHVLSASATPAYDGRQKASI